MQQTHRAAGYQSRVAFDTVVWQPLAAASAEFDVLVLVVPAAVAARIPVAAALAVAAAAAVAGPAANSAASVAHPAMNAWTRFLDGTQ